MSVVSCGWKNMENGWKNLWKSGSRWMKCMSGRNGGNKINEVEGVMLSFGYTVGNIINIPSIPCY